VFLKNIPVQNHPGEKASRRYFRRDEVYGREKSEISSHTSRTGRKPLIALPEQDRREIGGNLQRSRVACFGKP